MHASPSLAGRSSLRITRPQGDSPCEVPALEPLEPRLLLSADWAGAWQASGYMLEAETSWNRAWFNTHTESHRFTFTELGGGDWQLKVAGVSDPFVLTEDGEELVADIADYETDGGDYIEAFIRIRPIDDNAVLFFYADGGWDSDAKTDLYWASSYVGLVTRGSFQRTKMPWAGEYEINTYDVSVDTNWGSGTVEIQQDQFIGFLADIGGGYYVGMDPQEPELDDPTFLKVKSTRLENHDKDYDDEDGTYVEKHEWVLRGPNDTLYFVGGEAVFDSDAKHVLWSANFWAGTCTPVDRPDDADLLFDADSDTLTNPWLGLTEVGDGYVLTGTGDFDGAIRTFSLTGQETVMGVDCVVLNVFGHGENPVQEYYDLRIAQDRDGNLRVLKVTGMNDGEFIYWQADSPGTAGVFIAAEPYEGMDLASFPNETNWIDSVGQSVVQLATGAGPWDDCALHINQGPDWKDYAWYHPGQGVVYEEWRDDGGNLLGTWERTDIYLPVADWTGRWTIRGAGAEAGSDWGGGWFSTRSQTERVTITRLPNGMYFAHDNYPWDGNEFEGYGNELRCNFVDQDSDGNREDQIIRLTPLSGDAAVLLYAEGTFSPGNDLLEALWFSGLATKGTVTPTPRPWAGQYDLEEINLGIADGEPVDPAYGQGTFDIADLGRGRYLLGGTLELRRSGAGLVASTTESNGQYSQARYWVYRGPGDVLYYYSIDVSFDSPAKTDLISMDVTAGVARPQDGFEYKPDLTPTVDMGPVHSLTLPGDRFKVPVVVANDGTAPAKGKVRIDLYLSQDDELDYQDICIGSLPSQYLNIAAGRTKTLYPFVQLPDDADYGDYHIIAAVDRLNAILELDENNNAQAGGETFGLAEARRDLVGELTGGTLGQLLIPGDRGRLALLVTNCGNIPATGRITVNFYASTDQTLDQGQDILLATLRNQSVRLGPDGTTWLRPSVKVPADMPAGTYYLLADIDADDAIVEFDEVNNLAATEQTGEVVWWFGAFAGRRNVRLTVLDATGLPVTFSVTGGAWGEVSGDGNFDRVEITDTTKASTLTISTPRRARTTVDEIVAHGSMRRINAATTNLGGDLTVEGLLGSLVLANVTDDHTISINGGPAADTPGPRDALTMTFDRLADVVIDTHGLGVASLKATEWLDGDGAGDDRLIAPWVQSIRTTGRKKLTDFSAGDFAAAVDVSGLNVPLRKKAFGTADIAGDLLGSIDVDGDLQKLLVGGYVRGTEADPCTVRATGDILYAAMTGTEHADFLAGVKDGKRHAENPDDFLDNAVSQIKYFNVKGVRNSAEWFFVDTTLSAVRFGTVLLRNVDETTGLRGLFAKDSPTDDEFGRVTCTNTATPSWTWPVKPGTVFGGPADFINVL